MSLLSDKPSKKKKGQGQADPAPDAQVEVAADGAGAEEVAPADPLDGLGVSAEEFAAAAAGVDAEPAVEEETAKDESQDNPPPPAEPAKRAAKVRVLFDVPKFAILGTVYRFKKGDVLDANHYDDYRFSLLLEHMATEPVEE
jgi:hypothetical protein